MRSVLNTSKDLNIYKMSGRNDIKGHRQSDHLLERSREP